MGGLGSLSSVIRLVLALLCLAVPGAAQGLTLGAVGGVRASGDAQPTYSTDTSSSKLYLVGPMVEVQLPFHFAFEADALYSRLGKSSYYPFIANEYSIRNIANSWEFPLLVKYRLPVRRVHPYVCAGAELRHASGQMNGIHYGYYLGDITFFSSDWSARDHAFVAGGGIDVEVGRFRISPGVRYVRRTIPSYPNGNQTAFYLLVPPNEAQVLLEIGWHPK